MNYSGPLNDKQKAQLQQFRVNIQDVIRPEFDDEYLLRWIRAREWDLKKAEQMLRANLEWRKKYGADNILEEYKIPEVFKYFPGGYLGVDKSGCPIWWELLGIIDIRGVIASASKKDIVKYRMYYTEMLYKELFPECSKKAGKRIDKITFVVDVEGISLKFLWKPAIDVYIELLSYYEAYYPETLGQCYVINAPSFLPILYNAIKPFLAEYTRSKINFLGKNWKEVLLEKIDADQFPVHWGGTKTDPDGDIKCKSLLNVNGSIPESFYLKNNVLDIDLSQFTTISVSRAASTKLEFQVDQPGSVLSWNFFTNDNDIGFGVYRRTADGKQKKEDMEEVVDNCRVNSHIVPECGTVQCDVPGTYVVRFDNTYSWLNAKKVSYLIQVIAPDKDVQKQVEQTAF